MLFYFNFYSALLLIFFTQLLVFAVLIYLKGIREQRLSSKLLAVFLALSGLFIFPWMAGFAGWYDGQPYRDVLFYTPFVQGLFLGPLLFFYFKSLVNDNFRISGYNYLHFLPGALYLLWAIVVVLVDKLFLKRYSLMNGISDPDFDRWYSWLWSVSMLTYLFLTLKHYRRYRLFTYQELSFADSAGLRWMQRFLVADLLLVIVLIADQFSSLFTHATYVLSWYYFMGFAGVSYYIAISAYGQDYSPLAKLHFNPAEVAGYDDAGGSTPKGTGLTEDSIEADEKLIAPLKHALLQLLEVDKIYLDPELTLTALAKLMKTNHSVLSKVVNTRFGMPFNDLINNYRVDEAKALITGGRLNDQTMLAVAFDAGFNSKATFNRAFKKHTGLTPKQFQMQLT
ncbi:helix-turn-helix domain-containing protein [Mucilaginibacter celer]|uniref:Helix-turn-helix domain-containing protein n=1 Tax=Mucilaginibacter celer TaxID=2305508 RepID=A0A494VTF3_9SPHI|nr:helix-turn-helix domain-containing protein [Mucilaginibacter celer]AYL98887.1 helix-turn-helix domain-containing protein [Mucilaginibacter celer]